MMGDCLVNCHASMYDSPLYFKLPLSFLYGVKGTLSFAPIHTSGALQSGTG